MSTLTAYAGRTPRYIVSETQPEPPVGQTVIWCRQSTGRIVRVDGSLPAIAFVGSAVATLTDPGNGVGSVTTSSGLTVQAGDVLVALCSDPVSSVVGTDSLNSLTVGSFADNNGNQIGFAWRLAGQASTGELFRATASGLPQSLSLTVLQFRPPTGATVTLDAPPAIGATSWTATASSGTISTTGTSEILIGGMVSTGQASIYSSMTLAGVAVDGAVSTDYQTVGYRIVAAAQSGVSAVASAATSSNLIAGILAIKAA